MGETKRKFRSSNDIKGEFLQIFWELCYSRQPWQVWSDFITATACSIANSTGGPPEQLAGREKEYAECIKRLGGVEQPAQLFSCVVMALENNSDQDFLGSLYMELDLGNHWKGQFFTPYTVSRMMAEITMGNCQEQIDKLGWISICDPCVGGGAMLVAAANTALRQGINYQQHMLFVGQDIDRVVGMMAYIQMSLLGCPGYIIIANSLTNPIVGSAITPEEQEGQEFWYTPFYYYSSWVWRRQIARMNSILSVKAESKEAPIQEINQNIVMVPRQRKRGIEGQLSIFDLMGVNYEAADKEHQEGVSPVERR